ncbi:MAG: hypothetical protein ACFFD2_24830 [Promethearchaeota archaeon]
MMKLKESITIHIMLPKLISMENYVMLQRILQDQRQYGAKLNI